MKNAKILGTVTSLILIVCSNAGGGEKRFPIEELPGKKQKQEFKPLPENIQEFFLVIGAGRLELVKEILDNLSPDDQKKLVNYVDETSGRWPLQLAMSGIFAQRASKASLSDKPIYREIMKSLASRGADINYIYIDYSGKRKSLLSLAVKEDDWDTVGLLLNYFGINPDVFPQLTNSINEKIKAIEARLKRKTSKKEQESGKAEIKKLQDIQAAANRNSKYYRELSEEERKKKLEQDRAKLEIERVRQHKEKMQSLEPEFLRRFRRH
jgi:hypothetical protein